MAQSLPLPRTAPLRLPLKTLTAAGLFLAIALSALLFPQKETAPDMAWRGNSANLEAAR